MNTLHAILLQTVAISCAMIAGIFYAFSSFVMEALDRLPADQGAAAMNEINITVYTPSFMWFFMGTSLLCAALSAWSLFSIGNLNSQLFAAAGVLFLVGVFGVTAAFNVPLNNQLASASDVGRAEVWSVFMSDWTTWNTVRTVCASLSATLYVLGLSSS